MIIRIGDERRSMLEDHTRKLKELVCSDEALKHHRGTIVEAFLAAATNLPHKAFVYGALIAMIAGANEDGGSVAQEIVIRLFESLQTHLVEEKNVHASKNIMRVLAIACDYGVIASGCFS